MKSVDSEDGLKRRPIAARNTRWAAGIARWLAGCGLTPNQISVLSVVFAALGAGCLFLVNVSRFAGFSSLLYVGAAVCIQLRLLCNLFDGMVAIEGGLKSKSGEIYNELPDRISDSLFLVAAGYAARLPWSTDLGWAAAALAMMTAYVRTLGGQAGAPQQFCGPMAKQQRMFILTVACLVAAFGSAIIARGEVLRIALAIITAGCVVTVVRRTRRVVSVLESAPDQPAV